MFREIQVVHFHKKTGKEEDKKILESFLPGAFHLDTCQRWIWVVESPESIKIQNTSFLSNFEIYQNEKAYEFLLRVSCGLESELLGETDIFGQIKRGWQEYSEKKSYPILSLFMKSLVEDSKKIRTTQIQGWGASSYGSLVRKVLKNQGALEGDRVLLLGAGKLAQSILPYLEKFEITLGNRSLHRLDHLCEQLHKKGIQERSRFVLEKINLEEEGKIWSEMDHVIVCTPLLEDRDSVRIQFWNQNFRKKSLLHLGVWKKASGPWSEVKNAFFLDDLFQLEKETRETQMVAVELAKEECKNISLKKKEHRFLRENGSWELADPSWPLLNPAG